MEEEEARDGGATASRGSPEDTESQIKAAMQSRVSHFKEEADSLTFEGVRRLIEKDLGLETHALDVHKRFIKECLLECLEGGDDNASKSSGESLQNNVSSIKGEMEELSEGPQSKNEVKKSNSGSEEKMEDSPVMGLLTAKKALHSQDEKTQDNGRKADITERMINKAIKKRAAYFRANSEKVTMAVVRRLLEKDLELEKHALDPHKKFINEHVGMVLQSPEVSKSANTVKKKGAKESLKKKTPKIVSPEGSSDSSDSEDEENAEEDQVKPRKKTVSRGRMQKAEGLKKRKAPPAKENKVSKRIKPEEAASDSNGDSEPHGHDSEDGESHSSAERRTKKKEVSTPTYGKSVDRLKSIIKSCGMSVPPSIYKKVKQVSEDKREAFLMKELEEILSREGLSTNPTDKEIKEVKKRKERAKELEGIDTSNIVASSRRRTSSRYVAPPKPEIPAEGNGEEAGDSDAGNGRDDDQEDEDEDDDGNDESQSEELSEDQEESD
ncbi:glutamic acid-rich protein-like [Rhodamnia argentea]|uniref:Glutamic acid-rich protein-like n=1 Tax=Rhodamnia argentea TaxID=178133 RepID=A0ABM3H080_9MYRT|nr:glutamic acid-rich protein-like [Rhodamnia argentea]